MPSSPTLTVVDQFDEDEFVDVPAAPAALLAALRQVPDPRDRRGVRHPLNAILAVAACAVVTGARSFRAIAEWAADTCPALLTRVGVTGDPPTESTIRRTLQRIDGDGLDLTLGAWAALQHPPGKQLRAIAVEGKSVRGSSTAGRRCRHLLSALSHGSRLVLGQIDVNIKTKEIPLFTTLLNTIELLGVVVTADALHCQTGHAKYLIEQRGAHYLLTVKATNPPCVNNSRSCPGPMSRPATPSTTAATAESNSGH